MYTNPLYIGRFDYYLNILLLNCLADIPHQKSANRKWSKTYIQEFGFVPQRIVWKTKHEVRQCSGTQNYVQ